MRRRFACSRSLRVWFYEHLEPLAPARLQYYRGGDLLSRIRADIDSLDNVYLRVLAPTCRGHHHRCADDALPAWFSPHVAAANFAGLLLAGVVVPLLALRRSRAPGRRRLRCAGHCAPISRIRCAGFGELLVYQALDAKLAASSEAARR